MDLATARELHFISLSDDEVARTQTLDATVRRDVIPSGAYRGQEQPVATLSTPNVLVVRADMDEDLAYSLVRVLLESQSELARVHPVAGRISAEYTLEVSPIPLHPGVVRYMREQGIDVPERLIPSP
jgi:TRAP transporter TAXI family solute receptor